VVRIIHNKENIVIEQIPEIGGEQGRMNPELKALWLAALRGDGYYQTEGVLRSSISGCSEKFMCCLGVLEDVCSDRTKSVWLDNTLCSISGEHHANYLSRELTELGNFTSRDPYVPVLSVRRNPGDDELMAISLSMLNDEGLTFPQIADVIEYFF
jgi:hypothetical protein